MTSVSLDSKDRLLPERAASSPGWLSHERSRFMLWMIAPALVVLFVITVYPTLVNLYQSLFSFELTHPDERQFVFLQNYADLIFNDARFINSTLVTVYYVAVVLTVELIVGFAIAGILSEITWGRGLLTTIIVLPMASAPVGITFIWRLMFNPSIGILDHLLESVGLPRLNFLSEPGLVIPSLALVDIWQWTPFIVLILTAGLMSLPREPFEAARVDGTSRWQEMLHITLPMMRPFILVAMLFRGIDAFKTFDYIYILTKGGPGTASETLNLRTFQTAMQFLHMGYASAMAVMMLILVTVFCMILIRRLQVTSVD